MHYKQFSRVNGCTFEKILERGRTLPVGTGTRQWISTYAPVVTVLISLAYSITWIAVPVVIGHPPIRSPDCGTSDCQCARYVRDILSIAQVGQIDNTFSLNLGPNRSLSGTDELGQRISAQGPRDHGIQRFSIVRTSRFAVRRWAPDSICFTRLPVLDLFGSITIKGCNDDDNCFDLVVHGKFAITIQVEVAISKHKACCRCPMINKIST